MRDHPEEPNLRCAVEPEATPERRRTLRVDGAHRMRAARLRIYPRADGGEDGAGGSAVPIRLVDLYPVLAEAYRDNYIWLQDFEDDQILVSHDLFEVVRAFSGCRPSA